MKKLFVLALMGSLATVSQAFLIDDFTTGAFNQTINSGSWVGSQAGTMLGGERDAGMIVVSNPLNLNLNMQAGSGFAVTSGETLISAQVGFDYDGVGDEIDNVAPFEVGPGLGGLDLTATADRFRVNFLANDLPLSATVHVFTYNGGLASSFNQAVGANQTPFSVDFEFANFTGNADFTEIDRIVFVFDTAPSGDFALSSLETVPEPGTMIALGAGIAAIAARRRRKK